MDRMELEKILKEHAVGMNYLKSSIAIVDGEKVNRFLYDGSTGILSEESNEDIYEIGSVTKTFTAAVLCKLMEMKKISLEDDITKYIQGLDSNYYYPTVLQLATHTAGYSNDINALTEAGIKALEERTKDFSGNFEADCIYQYLREEDFVENIMYSKLEDKEYPFSYSNMGYATLGMILGKVGGAPIDVLLQDIVEKDFHMLHTTVDIPKEGTKDRQNTLTGYGRDGENQGNWIWKDSGAKAAGAIYSNLSDMVQYLKAMMTNTPHYLKMAHDTVYAESVENSFGIGLAWIKEGNITWHNGGTGCFRSFVGFREDLQKGVVVLENYQERNQITVDTIGKAILWAE